MVLLDQQYSREMSIVVLGFPGTSVNRARKALQTLDYRTIDTVNMLASCLSVNDIFQILQNGKFALVGTPISLLWEDIADCCPETKFILLVEDAGTVANQVTNDAVSKSGSFYFKLVDNVILWLIQAGLLGQYVKQYRQLEDDLIYAKVHPILTQSKYYFTIGVVYALLNPGQTTVAF